MLWSIIIISKNILSNKDKNLVADLINAESHNTIKKYKFVLHDILEGSIFSEAIIEGKIRIVENLRRVLIDNTYYKVIYKKIG